MKKLIILFLLVMSNLAFGQKNKNLLKEFPSMIDDCKQKHPFKIKELKNKDTLMITANFGECGEFGGSMEVIEIINTRGTLKAFKRPNLQKKSPCDSTMKSLPNTEIILTKDKRDNLDSYLVAFNKFKCNDNVRSNTTHEFTISIGVDVYIRRDWIHNWKEYEKLRSVLFN